MAKVSPLGFYNDKLLEKENMLQIAVLFLLFLLLIPLKFFYVLCSFLKGKKKKMQAHKSGEENMIALFSSEENCVLTCHSSTGQLY